MVLRLALLVVLTGAVAVVALAHRARRRADARRGADGLPPLPDWLVARAGRTWVVVTTPWCRSCDVVESDLQQRFPHDTVVKVDAVDHPDLARRYDIRRAPTVLGAGSDGVVSTRAVGVDGLHAELARRAL
jgi:hypothetical protein